MIIEPTPLSNALTVTALPAFTDNYLWLLHDAHGNAIAIDPGDGDRVQAHLHANQMQLRAILITHHHPDHIGGVALLTGLHACPVIGPDDARITMLSRRVGEGDHVEFDQPAVQLQVLHLPGHTRSHLAYVGHGAAFVGDTLFSAGCGRLFEGTPAQMLHSLDRLSALPADTQIFCAHEYTRDNLHFALEWEPGNPSLQSRFTDVSLRREHGIGSLPTTIGQELSFNPFLRCDQPELRAHLQAATAAPISDRLAAFTRLRELKNSYVVSH